MVGAKVGNHAASQAHDQAVRPGVNLEFVNLIAAVNGRLQVFAPPFDPFHGPAEFLGGEASHALLAVNVQLAPKSSAHFGRDDAASGLIGPGHHREVGLQQMRDLRRGPDREGVFTRRVAGDDAARLHRSRRQALVHKPRFDRFEARVGLDSFPVSSFELGEKGEVVRELLVDARRALIQSLFRVHDCGERLVVHVQLVRGVARGVRLRGDDGGDGLADVAHLPEGQARVLGNLQPFHRHRAWDQSQLTLEVGPGENFHDAGHGPRRVRLYGLDSGVGVGAAHEDHVHHAVQPEIVHVVPAALDEPRVLFPLDPLS